LGGAVQTALLAGVVSTAEEAPIRNLGGGPASTLANVEVGYGRHTVGGTAE